MYELQYVKKRKRRKWVAIGGAIATVGVSTLSIVAFLGRYVGTFTVSLNTGDLDLSLSDSSAFKRKESFLRVDELPQFHEFTYEGLPQGEVIDSEEANYLHGANYTINGQVESLNYFKYTFFVKNSGKVPAKYKLTINITDNKAGDDGRTLDDTLRVMLYENSSNSDEHKIAGIYAKRSATSHTNEKGEVSFEEPVSMSESMAKYYGEEFLGYAKEFASPTVIQTIEPEYPLGIGEIRRYTLVNWLEGYDPQSDGTIDAPKGARLKLGVEINAYENQ